MKKLALVVLLVGFVALVSYNYSPVQATNSPNTETVINSDFDNGNYIVFSTTASSGTTNSKKANSDCSTTTKKSDCKSKCTSQKSCGGKK